MKSSLPRRRLIPRWRPVSQTLQTSEVASTAKRPSEPLSFDHGQFEDSVSAWRDNPTAGHLGDVIAFVGDRELEPRIADMVRDADQRGWAISNAQRDLFSDLREDVDTGDDTTPEGQLAFQSRVASLRKEIAVAPDNVMVLLDLAQLQLASGKHESAKRYLRTALSLAPNGRIVLRTVARLHVHLGDPERAHAMIARHPATKHDPWLMASEIALADAANTTSSMVALGRRLLKEKSFAPASLAELAGAIANRELAEGRLKDAREHFRQALQHPTDNIAAQAIFDAKLMDLRLDEPSVTRAVQNAAEARLFRAWLRYDETTAEQEALRWHMEEPFSSRPLQFLTALYGIQGQHEKALRWVKRGLVADPKDSGLLRNWAFHEAAHGDLDLADATVRKVRPLMPSADDPYLVATQGLIALRRGEVERGGVLYREAELAFAKLGRQDIAALCLLHYAKYAKENGAPDADKLLIEAEARAIKHPTVDSRLMLAKMSAKPIPPAGDAEEQRRLSQWVFDPVANTLTQRGGVTARGAPPIVIAPSSKPPAASRGPKPRD